VSTYDVRLTNSSARYAISRLLADDMKYMPSVLETSKP